MRPMFVLGVGLALACPASSAVAALSVKRLEAFGFASLDGWHVGPCTLPLSRPFACTHLAKESLRATASEARGEEAYIPMALNCPESGSGVLGLISTNGLGHVELLSVVYDAHVPRRASVGTAGDAGSDIKENFSYRIGPEFRSSDADEALVARRIVERSELLKTKVCDAGE